ncbi:MAG: PilZ domain-containing protein [Planctomycetota bacterium]
MALATQQLVEDQKDNILEESIRDERHLVLTERSPQGWRLWKSRFVTGSKAAANLLVKLRLDEGISHTLEVGSTVGVTFRTGHMKCMFRSTVEQVQPRPDGDVLKLLWPENIQRLQRRIFERTAPPRGQVVAVKFWREASSEPSNPSTSPAVIRHGQMEDLSAGGLRIHVADPGDIQLGTTYRCSFAPNQGAPHVVLESILLHKEAADRSRISLGFQFVGLDSSADGRKTLDRLAKIVSQYQRSRSSTRHKTTVASGQGISEQVTK